jgi:pyruvate kinase
MSRRAKIICTIGPASCSREMMRLLLLNGMDVARFNFSHGGPEKQAANVAQLREISAELDRPVALLQDLQGPKIRTGPLSTPSVELVIGQHFVLTTRPVPGDNLEVSTTYSALPKDCKPGDTILLDDGLIALKVEKVSDTDVACLVTDGGTLKTNKGINLPGVAVSAPALSEKDRHDVAWGLANDFDYIALSFVRQADEVRELKQMALDYAAQHGGSSTQIIAKLEKPEAIDNLEEILQASDGVMVARGDLGVEMEPERVPMLQKHIIKTANAHNKIVITATQMLESMTTTQRPTRAEASDVANAVLDGTDALMLSGETASGAHPIASLQMMSRIIREIEDSTDDGWSGARRHERHQIDSFPLAICEAAAHAAAALGAQTIACFTESGGTARLLSKFRPPVPIIAFTTDAAVVRQLKLAWGVRPHLVPRSDMTDQMIVHADQFLVQLGDVKPGDIVVVTLGAPVAMHGSTNVMKLHRVGEADIN